MGYFLTEPLAEPACNEATLYEYGPFGEMIVEDESGLNGWDNPFQFSTKYQDSGTGLYYYGLRYYEAETGRWMSRDPIGEIWSTNLYSNYNNFVNDWDIIGLAVGRIGNDYTGPGGEAYNHKVLEPARNRVIAGVHIPKLEGFLGKAADFVSPFESFSGGFDDINVRGVKVCCKAGYSDPDMVGKDVWVIETTSPVRFDANFEVGLPVQKIMKKLAKISPEHLRKVMESIQIGVGVNSGAAMKFGVNPCQREHYGVGDGDVLLTGRIQGSGSTTVQAFDHEAYLKATSTLQFQLGFGLYPQSDSYGLFDVVAQGGRLTTSGSFNITAGVTGVPGSSRTIGIDGNDIIPPASFDFSQKLLNLDFRNWPPQVRSGF